MPFVLKSIFRKLQVKEAPIEGTLYNEEWRNLIDGRHAWIDFSSGQTTKSTIMMFTSSHYPTFSAFFNVKVYWHFPNIYSIAINDPRMNDDWPQDFYEKYCVFHAQMIKSMKMCSTT